MSEHYKNKVSALPKANTNGTSNLKKHTQKYPDHTPRWATLGNVYEGKIHKRAHDTRDTLAEQISERSARKRS